MVAGDRSGVPTLALEVRQLLVIDDCHHFHWRYKWGWSICISSEGKKMDTKSNCKTLKYSMKSTHDMIALKKLQNLQTMKTYQ